VIEGVGSLSTMLVPSLPSTQALLAILSLFPVDAVIYDPIAIEALRALTRSIVEDALARDCPYDDVDGLLTAIKILNTADNSVVGQSRKLLDDNSNSTTSALLFALSQFYAANMIPGQDDIIVFDRDSQMRFVFSAPGSVSKYTISSPLNELEAFLGINASTVLLTSRLDNDFKISTLFYPPSNISTLSNALQFQINDIQTCHDSCDFLATVQFRSTVDFDAARRYEPCLWL
jgi:hypothetical protein